MDILINIVVPILFFAAGFYVGKERDKLMPSKFRGGGKSDNTKKAQK